MNQEQIVDNLMITFLETKYPESNVRNMLEKATKSNRRNAILSIMDDDRRLFEQYKDIVKKESYCSEYAEEAVNILRSYIKVADVEVKKYGEIMTPLFLVEDMLDTLPKEVWSNPNFKWLDPCNGVGTFPSIVIKRLMQGLELVIEDPCERYRHIIEKMIYVCEIQEKNMFLFHCIFDREDNHELNTYFGSFLDDGFNNHMKNIWEVEGFDFVIGNPPYNIGTTGGNGGRVLWDKFVFKSVEVLNKDGYLVYVHPNKWRSPENLVFELFKKNNLKFLEIHSKKDGQKTFNAITRYDFYCLQKANYSGQTKIIDEKGEEHSINLNDWDFIPNYNFDLIKKIISKDADNNLDVIYSRSMYGNDKKWMKKEMDNENILPCVYGMYKDGSCSYRYTNQDRGGHFGIPKIILSCGEVPYAFTDVEGQYGMMNNCFGIKLDYMENVEEIIDVINGDNFSEIIESTKWSNFQIDYKMFKFFKKDFWKEFIKE